MNKNLHDMDDLFQSALEGYEETPSAGLKDSIVAALDKKDAGSYKKRFVAWKRTALLLFLLLSGIILYESGVLKKGSDSSDKKINSLAKQKEETGYQNNTTGNKTNNNKAGADDKVIIKNSFDNTDKTVANDYKIITQSEQKEIRSRFIAGITNPEIVSNKNLLTDIASMGQKNNLSNEDRISTLHPADKISFTKIISQLTNNITQLRLPPAIDSLSKSSVVKNKKITAFKPFWMLTSFGSYETAGYRLDSDLPNNITSIKYSEVHEPSFSIGLLATRQLTRHWGLQSGLIYSHIDIGISPQKLRALQDPAGDIAFKYITSSGYAYIKPGSGAPPAIGDSLITKEGKHSLKFISIPLSVKFTVGKNKLAFTPGAGIEANFLTSAKVETELESSSNPEIVFINKLAGTKSFHPAIVADAELRYKLNNKVSLSFRPAIRLAISPITKNNVVETFPRNAGVGIGVTYKF